MTRALRLCFIFALLAVPAFAQTAASRATLYTEIDTLFADTGADPITPAQLRQSLKNITASGYNELTDAALASTYQPLDSDLTQYAGARSDVAAATTTDIGAASTYYVRITGNGVAITSLGTATTGRPRLLTFSGYNTLTHDTTTLILPGLRNITTAPGDTALAVSEGSGLWRVLNYKRADGLPEQVGPFLALPRSGNLTAFGDSQTLGSNASGADYTEVDAYGARLKEAYRWVDQLANRDGRALTVLNLAEGSSKVSWDPLADTGGATYPFRSQFNKWGRLYYDWTGTVVIMPGWNNGLGTATEAEWVESMRQSFAALAARALIDDFGGIGIDGQLSTSTASYMTSWATTGAEVTFTHPTEAERINGRPFSITIAGGGYSLGRKTIELETTEYVEFVLSNKRAVAIFFETTADGGAVAVSVNGVEVWTGTSLYDDGTTERFPRVAWIENLPASATVRFYGALGVGEKAVYLAAGWTDYAPANGPRTVIFGSTSGNTAGSRTDAQLYRLALASREVCGAFSDYNIWHADAYSSWNQDTDSDAGDSAHFTPVGNEHVYQAFRRAMKISRGYISARVDLFDPAKARKSAAEVTIESAANTDVEIKSTGTGQSLLRNGTVSRAGWNGSTFFGVSSSGGATDLGTGAIPWKTLYLGTSLELGHASDTTLARSGAGTVTIEGATVVTTSAGNAVSATALATPRAIYGNNFDGTAALTQIIASTYGGTGNGFAKFSGPTTSEKTFTLPDATATILTSNAAVTVAQGGTGATTLTANNVVLGNGTSAVQFVAPGSSGNVLTSNGTTWTSAAPSGGGDVSISGTPSIGQVATWASSSAIQGVSTLTKAQGGTGSTDYTTATETLSNKTLTAPTLTGTITVTGSGGATIDNSSASAGTISSTGGGQFDITAPIQLSGNVKDSAGSFGTSGYALVGNGSGALTYQQVRRSAEVTHLSYTPSTSAGTPTATAAFFGGNNRSLRAFDSTGYTQARIKVHVAATASNATTSVFVRYHTASSATFADFAVAGASSTEISVALSTAQNTTFVGSWVNLTAGAIGDKFWIIGYVDSAAGGLTPTWAQVAVEFR